jgi:hypothetical protein
MVIKLKYYMSKNINKPIFGKEILFNSNGQVISKKRFIIRLSTQFYRLILRGS